MEFKTVVAEALVKFQKIGDDSIRSCGTLLLKAGALMVTSFAAIGSAVATSVNLYRREEAAVNTLNQAMINQGIYTRALSEKYRGMAEEFEKTGSASNDEIQSAQARLQMYLGHSEIQKPLIKAVLDFASAQGMDVESAAQVIGKSVSGEMNALARYGIAIDEQVSQSVKLREVISQLTSKFGGQHEASVQGLGALKIAKTAIEKVAQTFGRALAPLIVELAKGFQKLAFQMAEDGQLVGFIESAAKSMLKIAVVTKNLIFGYKEIIPSVIKKYFSSASTMLKGDFKKSYQLLEEANAKAAVNIKKRYQETLKTLRDIENAKAVAHEEKHARELAILRQGSQKRIRAQQEAIEANKTLFVARDDKEIRQLIALQQLKRDKNFVNLTGKMKSEQNQTARLTLEREKRLAMNDKINEMEAKRTTILDDLSRKSTQTQYDSLERVLAVYQQMQSSQLKALFETGKAAAIAAMIIAGLKSVALTQRWVSKAPFIGGVLAPIASTLVALWYIERIDQIKNAQWNNAGTVTAGDIFTWDKLLLAASVALAAHFLLFGGLLGVEMMMTLVKGGVLKPQPGLPSDRPGGSTTPSSEWRPQQDKWNPNVPIDDAGGKKRMGMAEGGFVSDNAFSELHDNMGTEIRVSVLGGLMPTQQEARKLALAINHRLLETGG